MEAQPGSISVAKATPISAVLFIVVCPLLGVVVPLPSSVTPGRRGPARRSTSEIPWRRRGRARPRAAGAAPASGDARRGGPWPAHHTVSGGSTALVRGTPLVI